MYQSRDIQELFVGPPRLVPVYCQPVSDRPGDFPKYYEEGWPFWCQSWLVCG